MGETIANGGSFRIIPSTKTGGKRKLNELEEDGDGSAVYGSGALQAQKIPGLYRGLREIVREKSYRSSRRVAFSEGREVAEVGGVYD